MDRRNFNGFVLSVQQRTEKHTGKQIIEFHSISFRVVKIQSPAGIFMKCILIFWGVPPEIRQMAEPRGRAMRGFRLRRRLRRSSDPLAFLAAPTIPHRSE